MDPKNKFDEKLKDLLNQHSEQAPDSVWEKIAGERKQRKAGGWFSKYRLALLLLLTGIGSAIYFLVPTSEYQVVSENELKDATLSSKELQGPVPVLSKEIENQPDEKSLQNKTLAEIENGQNEIPGNLTKNAEPGNKAIKKKNRQKVDVAFALNIPVKKNTPEKGKNAKNKNENLQPLTGNSEELLTKSIGDEVLNQSDNNNDNTDQVITNVNDTAVKNEQAVNDSLISEQEEKKDSTQKENTKETDKSLTGSSSYSFAVEIYISPEFAAKHLSEKSPQEATYYLQGRQESETRDYAFCTGMNVRYSINERYFVRAGIRYSQINEKFYSRRTNVVETISSIDSTLKGYIIDPFLPPVPYYEWDTTYKYIPYYYVLTANNSYSFIDIPVSAGVQFKSKRFDFYFSAGVEFNLKTTSKGLILAPDTLYLLTISIADQSPVKKKSSLSVTTGFGYAYHISEKFDLLFEPNFRHQLGSMTKKEYPLNQKYSRIGIIAGIKYNIRYTKSTQISK